MEVGTDDAGARHERARRAALGFLAAAILHETNNVLTVMDGVRQLMKAGMPLSDQIGSMIDQQLARMEELVGAIRQLGSETLEHDATGPSVSSITASVERLLELAGKGRGLAIERSPALQGCIACPRDGAALGLVLLCAILAHLPVRRTGTGMRVRLDGGVREQRVTINVQMSPADAAGGSEPEVTTAVRLTMAAGGTLTLSSFATGVAADVAWPAR